MNSNQTLNPKLKLDELLKALKVIDFLFFFSFCFSSWLLAYLPAIALKAAAESDLDLTRKLFPHNSLYIFWPTSGLKV